MKIRRRHDGSVESFCERAMDAHIGNQLNTNEGVQFFSRLWKSKRREWFCCSLL